MSDIEIARNAKLKNINEITKNLGIPDDYVENYGKYKAKISLDFLKDEELKNNENNIGSDSKIAKNNKSGKLILVTSINPTPFGEGKTTASIGLCDGLNRIFKEEVVNKIENNSNENAGAEFDEKSRKKAVLALREPSMGPVFGIKGGATGGGNSQVAPMEDINLHFTGDIHAITSANNLLSALIDNHIYFGNEKDIQKVTWKRCLDLNDRELRKVEVGLSGEKNIKARLDGFDISVASEIMAILCLSEDLKDLKRRLGNIIVGYNSKNEPVTCRDLKADGALAVILKDAIKPNVVQTLENNAAFIHGGPFANIAHGCNSILATKMALKTGDYVVTEAGFGADLGAEKFVDIKCRKFGLSPDCVVIVATIRALEYHGGASKDEILNRQKLENYKDKINEKFGENNIKKISGSIVNENSEIEKESYNENAINVNSEEKKLEYLRVGIKNLKKHIENVKNFGLNPIVAINKFNEDSAEEIKVLEDELNGICEFSLLESWEKGSLGAVDLAEKVVKICETPHQIKFTYDLEDSIKTKIEKVAKNVYGADGVEYSPEAEEQIARLENFAVKTNKSTESENTIKNALNEDNTISLNEKNALITENSNKEIIDPTKVPICIAKTQYSFSDDEKNLLCDKPFKIHIREVEFKAGAEFIVVKTGKIMTMPGLPKHPASENIDINENGEVEGIF